MDAFEATSVTVCANTEALRSCAVFSSTIPASVVLNEDTKPSTRVFWVLRPVSRVPMRTTLLAKSVETTASSESVA